LPCRAGTGWLGHLDSNHTPICFPATANSSNPRCQTASFALSRDASASGFVFKRYESSPLTRHFHFGFPDNEGSGAPTGAPRLLPDTAKETAPVTGYSRVPHDKGRSPFGAPLRIDRTCVLPQPGPALPGITGCKREFCTPSPAPVQRAPRSPDTCRTGMMPRPPTNKSD
jgi:hypothetical protein